MNQVRITKFNTNMKSFLLLFTITSLVGIALSYIFISKDENNKKHAEHHQINHHPIMSNTTLYSAQTPIDIFSQQDPRLRVVFFGFTKCHDVCPTSLAVLASALNALSEQDKKQVLPLFISIDHQKDSPIISQEYAARFHQNIIGASGTEIQTHYLTQRYDVTPMPIKHMNNNHEQHTPPINHSPSFYFLAPNGEVLEILPYNLNVNRLLQTITKHLPKIKEENNTTKT